MMRRRRSSKYRLRWLLCLVVILAGASAIRSGLAQTSSGSWTTLASMPTARSDLAAAPGADDRIYAIGGADSSSTPLNMVEAYDPSSNTWSTAAPMPTARVDLAAATGVDGRIYAIGGNNVNGNQVATVEAYNPATNTWSTVAPMPTLRASLAAATGSDGRIYAIGGSKFDGQMLDAVEAYDPSTNTWSTMAPMSTPRRFLAAASGADGCIYAFGGATPMGPNPTSTVEAYTPAKSRTGTSTVIVNSPTETAMPTSTPAPTSTLVALKVNLKLGKRSVRPGQQQSVTVSTEPSAQVTVTLTFPNHHTMRHNGTASASGKLIWRFKEPRGTVRGQNHTVKVAVQVHDASGQTASATGRYTTG